MVDRFFPFRFTNISGTAGADPFSARERIRQEVDLCFLRLWKFLLAHDLQNELRDRSKFRFVMSFEFECVEYILFGFCLKQLLSGRIPNV